MIPIRKKNKGGERGPHLCIRLVGLCLNAKVDSLPFAATVAAAAPLQHYMADLVHQPWDQCPWHSGRVGD